MANDRHARPLFAAGCMLALTLLWSPYPFLNDELPQSLGLDGLSHGHPWVQGPFPADYQLLHSLGWSHWAVPDGTNLTNPVGSTPLNVLALPVLGTLVLLAGGLGPPGALAVVVSVFAGATACLAASRRATLSSRPRVRLAIALAATVAVAALAALVPASRANGRFILEVASIQLVSMGCLVASGLLVQSMLAARFSRRASWTLATAYVSCTPLLFWGVQTKYHSLAAALVVAVMWALDRARERKWAFVLAGVLAAISVWNQLPLGAIVAAAVGVTALATPQDPGGRSASVLRFSAGFLIGLLPLTLEWVLLGQKGLGTQYLPPLGLSAPVVHPGSGVEVQTAARGPLVDFGVFHPKSTLEATWKTLVWTNGMKVRGGMSFASIMPFLAFALASVSSRPLRQSLRGAPTLFASALVVILFPILGAAVLDIGAGFDIRHAIMLVPAFFWFAAPAMATAIDRLDPKPFLGVLVGFAVFAFGVALMLNFVTHHAGISITHLGRNFDARAVHRYLGIGIATAIAVACTWWRIRGAQDPSRMQDQILPALLALALGAAVSFQVLTLLIRDGLDWTDWNQPLRTLPMEAARRFASWMIYSV